MLAGIGGLIVLESEDKLSRSNLHLKASFEQHEQRQHREVDQNAGTDERHQQRRVTKLRHRRLETSGQSDRAHNLLPRVTEDRIISDERSPSRSSHISDT